MSAPDLDAMMHLSPHRMLAPGGRRVAVWCVALAGLGLVLGAPAVAEIVIFADGGWLKVDAFALIDDGARMRLDLTTGGAMNVPVLRIARILDDEVVPEIVEPPPPVPSFAIGWHDTQPIPAVPYGEEIHGAAQAVGLNPALVAAVVRAESAFRADAVSHKGAQGLMQLMPATAQRFGVIGDEVFVPAHNLRAGCRYLRWLLDRFDGELDLALAGYNAGEGTVARYGGVPPYRETRDYIARVYDTLGIAAGEG